jgi:SAM-dependent methyltransferase
MTQPRRLVFGEVADLYDAVRPSYPDAVIDDLVALAPVHPGGAALEVGAGTGKATRMVAARGISVVAVEPSPAMARLIDRNAAGGAVTIERSDFERWDPLGRTFALVFAAQSWHWVDPDVAFPKAASVLAPGGVLAAFWNRVIWEHAAARDAVATAYRRAAPELDPDHDPMHPGHILPRNDDEWAAYVERTSGLERRPPRAYEWRATYSPEGYRELLATHSALRMLGDERREALLEAVHAELASAGPTLELPMRTEVCLARRAG